MDRFMTTHSTRHVDIRLLAVDLTTCTRCRGTLANIEKAIDLTSQVLLATNSRVRFDKILIETEEQATRERFVSSPTIRVNGRDIARDVLESPCDSCSDLCGCDGTISCRVWRYQDREYNEAPVGLIVESILREVFAEGGTPDHRLPVYSGVPENLRRFFAGRSDMHAETTSSCCSAEEQRECCEPVDKAECCATDTAGCGCR
jgi:hypothetical protein